MANPTFTWNPAAQRYRYSSGDRAGQFVGKAKVRSLMESFIKDEKTRSDRITANLLNGGISLKEWEVGMAARIKAVHSTAYLLGKGGALHYDSAIDRGRIGAIVKREYYYLRDFSKDIQAGKLSEAQIRARTKSYMETAYATEQRAEEYGHADQGYRWEENLLTPGESCPDCVGFTGMGIVAIGTIPPIGQGRQCRNRCRCHKKYYRDKPEERSRPTILMSRWGWAV